MTDREKYILLSDYPLSDKDQSYIIELIRGATLTWEGDGNNVKRNTEGKYQYALECSGMTRENKVSLKGMMLEVKLLSGSDSETDRASII